jgi:hypothetical protein
MGSEDALFVFLGILGLFSLTATVFYILRGIDSLTAWRNGVSNELWHWLSLFLGACGAFFIGLLLVTYVAHAPEPVLVALLSLSVIGLILGLAAVSLTTIYYILRWRTIK